MLLITNDVHHALLQALVDAAEQKAVLDKVCKFSIGYMLAAMQPCVMSTPCKHTRSVITVVLPLSDVDGAGCKRDESSF